MKAKKKKVTKQSDISSKFLLRFTGDNGAKILSLANKSERSFNYIINLAIEQFDGSKTK